MIKEYSFQVTTNTENNILNENIVDESNFRSPHSYTPGTIYKKILKSIHIKNNDDKLIKNVFPVVNNKDLRSVESLLQYLEVNSNTLKDCLKIYDFINNNVFHAVSGFKEMYDPIKMLNWWGYCICGHNADALKSIFSKLDISSRRIKLNGHAVNEYLIDNRLLILDGDVKIHYLALDNESFCSFKVVVKDPFLIYRTKPYGIYQVTDTERKYLNMTLFEYIEQHDIPLTQKHNDTALLGWDLYPGESIMIDYENFPDRPLNTDKVYNPANHVVENSTITVIHKLNFGSRHNKQLLSFYPIYKIENTTNKETILLPRDKIINNVSFDHINKNDEVLVYYQVSILSMPEINKGDNLFVVKADSTSNLGISIKISEDSVAINHKPKIINKKNMFEYINPYFDILINENIQKLWWQISSNPCFNNLNPSFNNILEFSERICISDLDATFLNNNSDYYFRCKALKNNVWSDWSETFTFRQIKPNQPLVLCKVLDNNQIEFKIENHCNEEEYMIFGDNRLDFIPEIYTKYKCISFSDFSNLCFEVNENHLVSSRDESIIVDKRFPFYRIISKKGHSYSVPSKIIQLDDLLDHAQVLQCRTYYANEARKKQGHVNYEGKLLSLQ